MERGGVGEGAQEKGVSGPHPSGASPSSCPSQGLHSVGWLLPRSRSRLVGAWGLNLNFPGLPLATHPPWRGPWGIRLCELCGLESRTLSGHRAPSVNCSVQ